MCLFASNISKINFENSWSDSVFDKFQIICHLWNKNEIKVLLLVLETQKVCKKGKNNQNYCKERRLEVIFIFYVQSLCGPLVIEPSRNHMLNVEMTSEDFVNIQNG